MSFKPNSLFYSDGYKVGHRKMLAPGTTKLYGTWIPRSTKHAGASINKVVTFGFQLVVRWLHDEYQENFFNLPKQEALSFGKDMSLYLGMEYDASHFEALYDLGYLPIKIKALPEGIETPVNVPHMTFVNTVPGFAWLTLYLETIISALAWKPATSATLALAYRRQLTEWVMKTDPSAAWLIPYLAHDFSARGLDPWSMLSSGLGHATSFRGSDSIICIPAARYYYGESKDEVCINSVNASEHSVSTTCIFTMGESDMLRYFMDTYPDGILSVVSDTFDLFLLITEYLPANKTQIMSRNGKLVIRPDSGDPVEIICGKKVVSIGDEYQELDEFKREAYYHLRATVEADTPHGECGIDKEVGLFTWKGNTYKVTYYPNWNRYDKQYYYIDESFNDYKTDFTLRTEQVELTPREKGVIQLLWEIFGGTINEQGYKVLDSHIGAIYGDSITLDRQLQIYSRLADKGFACTNIVLGVGSFTYQFNTRDTLGFAAKGAYFEANGKGYDIYKDPATDDGTKKSLKGLVRVNEDLTATAQCTSDEENQGLLQVIYQDGVFSNEVTLSEIRVKLASL
jgi:nicotinamide phosphoribosyltransferase